MFLSGGCVFDVLIIQCSFLVVAHVFEVLIVLCSFLVAISLKC